MTMIPFSVIALGDFISSTGAKTAITSFANFYHNVTSKHQRRTKLTLIDVSENIENLRQICTKEGIINATSLLSLKEQEKIEQAYKSGSIFLFPVQERLDAIIQESMSYGLPILGFKDLGYEEYIDQTCGMLIKANREEENILELSHLLQLLYFDPEARQFLKRGATNRYRSHFSWGLDKQQRAGAR